MSWLVQSRPGAAWVHAAGPRSTSSSAKARQIQTRQKRSTQQGTKPGTKSPTGRRNLLAGAFKAKSFQHGPSPGCWGHCTVLMGRAGHCFPPASLPSPKPRSAGRRQGWPEGTAPDPASSNSSGAVPESLRSSPALLTFPCVPSFSPSSIPFPLCQALRCSWQSPAVSPSPVGEGGQEWGTADTAPSPAEGPCLAIACHFLVLGGILQ